MTKRELTDALLLAGIADADAEARILITAFCHVSAAELLASPGLSCDTPAFTEAVARRLRHEPLAYILGETFFYNERYRVSPDCLIPRPDTERLVEEAVASLAPGAHFADLCTGSGCIAISTLCHRPDATADAYDVSEKALSLAAENAALNGVGTRLSLLRRNLLRDDLPEGVYDAVLSNPPYIRHDVIPELAPEVQKEPRIALDGGDDGLLFYRRFLTDFRGSLKSGGFFLFEIGYDQGVAVTALAKNAGMTCEILRDYAKNDRVAFIR